MSYQYKEYTSHASHAWEDVSHHGSPLYECIYCHCYQKSENAEKACAKVEKCLLEIKLEEERYEKYEYQQMKKARERWEYLNAKYGTD